jgi:hypothetical protein
MFFRDVFRKLQYRNNISYIIIIIIIIIILLLVLKLILGIFGNTFLISKGKITPLVS